MSLKTRHAKKSCTIAATMPCTSCYFRVDFPRKRRTVNPRSGGAMRNQLMAALPDTIGATHSLRKLQTDQSDGVSLRESKVAYLHHH